MKKPKQSTVITLSVFLFIVLSYFTVMGVLGQPFYVLLLLYALVILAAAVIFRTTLMAIRGNLQYIRGNTEKAFVTLKKAVEAKTPSPAAHLNYAILLMRRGETETAFQCLGRAQELNKNIMNDKNIMVTLGTCYWVSGDVDMAIQTLEKLRSKYEYVNGSALTTLGYMYILKKDYEKALEITEKALEDMPEYAAAWDNLGQIYFYQNDWEKARENFEKALSYKEGLVDSLYFMGVIAEQEGDPQAAEEYFTRAANADISALNTVKKDEIEEKLKKYQ